VFAAVREGDAAAAQRAMRDHLYHVEQVLLAVLG
jgi:DNA-binding FadR family transcriptional regulator